ncbi:hypothetical protein O1W68_06455 [Rhodococcus sp. H36-A4]|uniref:hypothetical protein n=1 Tax=Rhodococcus sp. H36-A4 TaxID=3004353 RepID=UPI0022AFBC7F|nr:hypothetical protein [Rhodococcus sp. H36-A4]MCZ4077579.1 hypothetical protein [Rhodococcus sp. H36-A4]
MNSSVDRSEDNQGEFMQGDTVVAMQDLGIRAWRSGVPAGSVGTVIEVDWLTDLFVVFDVDGSWFTEPTEVEKVVAPGDVRLVQRADRHRG